MNRKDSVYYNLSGYFDPTAGRALDKIVQEEELLAGVAKAPKKRRRKRGNSGRAKLITGDEFGN